MKQKKNLLEEIKHNELMSKKDKMKRRTLNYFEHMLILTYALTGFVLISPFFFFFCSVGIFLGIKLSADN